jgi:hypothetical protein
MARYKGSIQAGWVIIGVQRTLKQLAWECDVDIDIETDYCLVGRTVSFRVTGTDTNVNKFQRYYESLERTSVF